MKVIKKKRDFSSHEAKEGTPALCNKQEYNKPLVIMKVKCSHLLISRQEKVILSNFPHYLSQIILLRRSLFYDIWILGVQCGIYTKVHKPKYSALFTGYTEMSLDGLRYYMLLKYEVNMILYN